MKNAIARMPMCFSVTPDTLTGSEKVVMKAFQSDGTTLISDLTSDFSHSGNLMSPVRCFAPEVSPLELTMGDFCSLLKESPLHLEENLSLSQL